MKGTATQSSTLAGGATGGHAPRAIDGGLEPDLPAGTDPLKGTRPVHERRAGSLVGARSRRRAADRHHRPVGRVRRHADRAVSSASSTPAAQPVFVQDGLRLQAPMTRSTLGGDLTIPLQTAAIAVLPGMRGHEAETVPLLRDAGDQAGAAAGGAGRDPPDAARRVAAGAARARWPPRSCATCAAIPPAQRTGPAVAEAFAFGRELVARLPEPPTPASSRRSSTRCSSASSASRRSRRR